MNREHIERLLALYTTDSLTDAERKELYAAALEDQTLFDQMAEADSIRELVAMPGAKARLIASLEEEESPVVAQAPSRWFAWASGVALVFVSGAISYLWFERPAETVETAAVRETPKPFTPPAPQTVNEPKQVVVDAPPPMATRRQDTALPTPVVAPLPSTPPPPPPAEVRERRAANEVAAVSGGADLASKAKVAEQVGASADAAKTAFSFRAAAPAAARPVKKEMQSQFSAWRRTGDGVWTRIPADDAVDRSATVAVRYTPAANGLYSLTNANGAALMSLTGRAGIELEFVLPQSVLANTTGDALRLGITSSQPGAVGGAIGSGLRDELKRQSQPGESITIRLK